LCGREPHPKTCHSQHCAGDDRDDRDDLYDAVELDGQRARGSVRLSGQRSNTGDRRVRTGGVDDTLSFALHHKRAGDYRVPGRVLNGNTFATDHGLIHRESMRDSKCQIGADPIPGSKDDKIAAYQLGCVDDPQLTVPAYPGAHRKQ
jgi:hypothetical protein